jgi:hypothetical protein
VTRVLFFKLEEEENPALLLHLPKLVAETPVFGSASRMGCWLVVATVQAAVYGKDESCTPLIISYQHALQKVAFWILL